MTDDLLRLPAIELAQLLRDREVSAVELADASLSRIAAHDGELRAFVDVHEDKARRRAERIDRRLAKGDELRALEGVPYAVKDSEAMRGARYRAGSRAYRHLWSPVDSGVVHRTRKLGVNIIGKTATSELALMPVIETDLQPPTVNPWNPGHTAGGSSGGAAAAVAAGYMPVAGASDGAGSTRIPASLCHLFGFKPSRDLTPNFYYPIDRIGLAVAGSVSHTVEDNACVLDVFVGRGGHGTETDSLRRACHVAGPKGLRVGVCVASPLVDVDPEIAAATQMVGDLLGDMGHEVTPHDGVHEGTLDEFIPIYGRLLANPPILSEAHLQPVTRWIRERGREISNREAARRAGQLANVVDEWFADFDIVVTPTVGVPTPRVGAYAGLEPEAQFQAAAELGAFTAPFNLSGQPAASIPAGLRSDGLPIGVQVIAARGADALLFSVCAELERALAWTQRAPKPRQAP